MPVTCFYLHFAVSMVLGKLYEHLLARHLYIFYMPFSSGFFLFNIT